MKRIELDKRPFIEFNLIWVLDLIKMEISLCLYYLLLIFSIEVFDMFIIEDFFLEQTDFFMCLIIEF